MPDALALGLVFWLAVFGFALLALSQERHWSQVTPSNRPSVPVVIVQRAIGFVAIVGALPLCMAIEGASFGCLLWAVLLSAAAAAVALVLTWAPGLLAPLARSVSPRGR
ncbi:DUF3325 domain-containing protein [Polaromonas sp.]|uniref:DUF3325 domain-containing protein n=1 Tax=Polaromonas sp. TaxID=1869339 RepID=UPI002FC7472E